MEVGLFPNPRRPGFGVRPRRESLRPLLPQHARHCPVLEAGSALGFLVHPPLAEHELLQVGYEGEGRYQLTYSLNPTGRKWEPIFTITFILPVGGIGATKEDVKMLVDATPESTATARLMARMFIVPDDLGTPAGAVTLRGAWNFQTPPGWDTVYTPIFNMIERPIAPMMVIRVQTDWYVHDTEFRYVLQPGETISASHSLPIGQVFFVPREEVTLRDGTEAEIAARQQASETFYNEKAASKVKTPYGLEYSPHYHRTSRRQNEPASGAAPAGPPRTPSVAAMDPLPDPVPRVGRNDPCPCGSGRKYKKCHGELQS
jgi:SEC-C motif